MTDDVFVEKVVLGVVIAVVAWYLIKRFKVGAEPSDVPVEPNSQGDDGLEDFCA